LLYDEVNDILQPNAFLEEIDDLLSTFGEYGMIFTKTKPRQAAALPPIPRSRRPPEIESRMTSRSRRLERTGPHAGMLERTTDPVCHVPARNGHRSALNARGRSGHRPRIERGQLLVLKTITRSPIILKELLTIGEDSAKGTRSIRNRAVRPMKS